MFLLSEPGTGVVERFLASRQDDMFSYSEVGATRSAPPPGYTVDHNRIKLGEGEEVFARAKLALCRWEMFNIGWVKLFDPKTPIETGRAVAILIKHFGFYSLNAARIVYVNGTLRSRSRFSFAYGTMTEHGEIGEERFGVEFHRDNGEVWYDLYAFSRPGALLAKIGYPLGRRLQKAFARDSKLAMLRATAS